MNTGLNDSSMLEMQPSHLIDYSNNTSRATTPPQFVASNSMAQRLSTKTEEINIKPPEPLLKSWLKQFRRPVFERIIVNFGAGAIQDPKYRFPNNVTSTTKY